MPHYDTNKDQTFNDVETLLKVWPLLISIMVLQYSTPFLTRERNAE
jgi:hypothetical protein